MFKSLDWNPRRALRRMKRRSQAQLPQKFALPEMLEPRLLLSGNDVTDFVSNWALDGHADDATGLNPAVLVNGPTFDAGRIDEAITLNGADQYVDLSAVSDDVSGDFTASFWVRSSTSSGEQALLAIEDSGGADKLALAFLHGDLQLHDPAAGGWQDPIGYQIDDGAWHQVAVTLSASTLTLYLDSYKLAEHTTTLALAADDQWSLGQAYDGSAAGDFFAGAIDDARVYDRALNEMEVTQLRRAQEPAMHPDNETKADEHHRLVNLLRRSEATHVAVTDGDWFDPATWQGGAIPTAGAQVAIVAGVSVTYNQTSDAALDTVRVDGAIHFPADADSRIVFDTMFVTPGGEIHVGSAAEPIQPERTVEFVIETTGGPLSEAEDPFLLGRGLISHGTTRIFGAEKAAHTTLRGDAYRNDTYLELTDSAIPNGWRNGDTLLLAGTEVNASLIQQGSNPNSIVSADEDNRRFRDELLRITDMTVVDGHVRVYFENVTNQGAINAGTTKLIWDHKRPDGATFDPEELSIHVANLTRNVVVRSSDPSVDIQQRGHFMIMHNPDAQVYHAQFKDLGRTDKRQLIDDPAALGQFNGDPGAGTNPRGRYSLHLHRVGATSFAGDKALVVGNVVWGNPGWAIVHHDSYADLADNVVFDVVGAGIVAEDGNELGTWTNNLVVKATGDLVNNLDDNPFLGPGGRAEIFDHGFLGSGYWLQGGGDNVTLIDNVAASINASGVDVFDRVDDGTGLARIDVNLVPDPVLRQKLIDAGYETVGVDGLPAAGITGMQVYNSRRGIHTWLQMRDSLDMEGTFLTGRAQTAGGANDRIGHDVFGTIDHFKIWGVQSGIHNFYSTRMQYENGLVVGDIDDPVRYANPNDFQANNLRGVGLTHNQNNANTLRFDGLRIEGFEYALAPTQVRESSGNPVPYATGALTNSQIANVDYAFVTHAHGTNAPRIFPDYFHVDEATTFATLTPNAAPTAAFAATSVGGRGWEFDADASSDPDPEPRSDADHDGIAAYAWDLDHDGQFDDAFGEVVRFAFDQPGSHTVGLKVWDSHGATATITQTIEATSDAYPNAFTNGSFDTAPTGITWYTDFGSDDRGRGWLIGDGQFELRNGQLFTDPTYSRHGGNGGLAQVVRDLGVRQGEQTFSVDLTNTEAAGSANEIWVRLYGINGQFANAIRYADDPHAISLYDTTVDVLAAEDVGGVGFDWTSFEWDVDLGEGYEYLVVHISVDDVDRAGGDEVGIDNVSLTGDSPAGAAVIDFAAYDVVESGLGQGAGDYAVEDHGATLRLYNNGWRKIDFPYSITSNTMLSFEFSSDVAAEIHGIGFRLTGDGNAGDMQNHAFQVLGSQNWGIQDHDLSGSIDPGEADYIPGEGYRSYTIPVGVHFTGNFDSLVFFTDDDAAPQDGESYFRNVSVFEAASDVIAPATPAGLAAAGGDAQVTLDWAENSETDLQGYRVYRSTSEDGTYNPVTPALLTESSFVDSDVTNGVTYWYQVTAVDTANNESAPTAAVAATADADPTIDFDLYDIGANGLFQTTGDYTVEDNGATLRLYNNGWRKIDLPYTVTSNTVLSFEFSSDAEAEIHGIGFARDSDQNAGDIQGRTFQVFGTDAWGIADHNQSGSLEPGEADYTAGEGFRTYTIPVGAHFTGSFDSLVFITDDDVAPQDGESRFRNVSVDEAALDEGEINFNLHAVTDSGLGQGAGDAAVQEDGSTLRLYNNGWRKVDFPYDVTADTVLEFDFKSDVAAEIHGIGFALDSDQRAGDMQDRAFQVLGSQSWGIWDHDNSGTLEPGEADYAAGEGYRSYSIPVGQHFTGSFDSLVFITDDDDAPQDGESYFRNVRVYEGGALMQAAAGGTAQATPLTLNHRGEVQPLIDAAMAEWLARGYQREDFSGLRFASEDLGGNRLGHFDGERLITLDDDGAGYGWFIDRTPEDDEEFVDGDGPDGIDLLSVVEHELGHALGLGHSDHGPMVDLLATGTRL